MRQESPRLFIFGPGYVGLTLARRLAGKGWRIAATARRAENATTLAAAGIEAVDPTDASAMAAALHHSRAILITAAPDADGCPAIGPIGQALEGNGGERWTGYLSSTGVYGDRGGRWVFEDSALNAQSVVGARRVAAERQWLDLGQQTDLAVALFRLPGIYGRGRSAFDRLREGKAQRLVRPGQVFSRIHVDDLCAALEASIARPRPGGIYNICDDAPSPPQDVITEAAALLGIEPPPETVFDAANVPAASQRFFAESKRVSNARAKAELDWRPAFVSYREGLRAILAAETGR
jgi:nucleoside-diphosphate-sugar epimerase